jgi:tyrosyl-tRNA synthetase
LISNHLEAPHLRLLQKKLAEELTVMVHSADHFRMAVEASQILFGQGTAEELRHLDEKTFLDVFEGVPRMEISAEDLKNGLGIMELLTEKTAVFPSRSDLRRTIQSNGLSINKEKITSPEMTIHAGMLIAGKYLVIQKGKKNYTLLTAR